MTRQDTLFQQIMRARNRVYQLCAPSPQESYPLPSGGRLLLKREDLSPIHAYKWRGAYNMMAAQPENILHDGVITASAGNHALGVALAASRLGCHADIYMPQTVARIRTEEVKKMGKGNVRVIITGDSYDQAASAARSAAEEEGLLYVPAHDDLLVMAGQGTIGDEIMQESVTPDVVFLQIGGGGLAAAVACVIKSYSPDIHIIGVEGENQASMAAAFDAGEPVTLPYVDVFCDGTAVRRAGDLTFPLCVEGLDELMTVSNDDVCAAIQRLWDMTRSMPEPAGAMGMAGFMKREAEFAGKNVAVIVTGANMDFPRLAWIAHRAGVGASRRYFEIKLAERSGTMLELLRDIADLDLNIEDFIYGKIHESRAYPVFGFAGRKEHLEALEARLTEKGYGFKDVSDREDVTFRIVRCDPSLCSRLYLAVLDFPERPGALMEFMAGAVQWCSICYFNYVNRGDLVGRALMGFEFASDEAKTAFLDYLNACGCHYQPVDPNIL